MSHLFLSYNSRDRDKVRAVHRYLHERGVATFFDQQNLRAGENWPQALERALRDSSSVAVFVGAQIGNWQWPEIGFALDRQAKEKRSFPVIPILVDGADTSRSFLFLNTWVDLRGDRLEDPSTLAQLLSAVSGTTAEEPAQPIAINPYRGLGFFDEEHAPFFFGRESFINKLFDRLTRQRKKFVAVVGASGSGKSSVVRAGLIPQLRRRRPPDETWDVVVFTPGERPWFRLANALAPLRFPDKTDTELDIEVDKLAEAFRNGSLQLSSVLDRILQLQGKLHRLLLVVDQFEEVFTLTKAEDRAAVIEQLMACLQLEGVVLVPTLRADFYGQAIESHRQLSDWLGTEQVTLGRLRPEELRRAVVEPARLARLEFDPGLPELLLRDAGNEPGSLPLLQHALLELYEKGKSNCRLTSKAYEEIGGIRRAIANSAEREYRRLEGQGKGQLVRQVFTQLVRLARADEGLEDTRRRIAVDALPAGARTIIDEFANYDLRLLVKASERTSPEGVSAGNQRLIGEQETVEVAHEALIREWDRLKGWLNEDRGFYLWRQRLDQALEDHELTGELLTGAALKEAEGKLAARMPEVLTERQKGFIEAGIEARDNAQRKEREREEQRRLEKEELLEREKAALTQAAQRKRRTVQISVAASLVLLAIATLAVWKFIEADDQREASYRAQAEAGAARDASGLAMLAMLEEQAWTALDSHDIASAMRYSLAGYEMTRLYSSTVQRQSEPAWSLLLATALNTSLDAVALFPSREREVLALRFSPDGTKLATASMDGTALLLDVATGRELLRLGREGRDEWATAIAFDPRGDSLAVAVGKVVELFDLRSGEHLRDLVSDRSGAFRVDFSPDGSKIFAEYDDAIAVWQLQSHQKVWQSRSVQIAAGFWCNEDDLMVVYGDRKIAMVSMKTYREQERDQLNGEVLGKAKLSGNCAEVVVPSPNSSSYPAKYPLSSDGRYLLRISKLLLPHGFVSLDDRQERRTYFMRGLDGNVYDAAYSRDGRFVATAEARAIRVWRTPTRENESQIELRLSGGAISPDGSRLLSVDKHGRLQVWDIDRRTLLRDLTGVVLTNQTSFRFSYDGSKAVFSTADGSLFAYDLAAGRMLFDVKGDRYSEAIAISSDGKFVATTSDVDASMLKNRTAVTIRDAGSGRTIATLLGHSGEIFDIQISPDGSTIVTCSADGTARIWDVPLGKSSIKLSGHNGPVARAAFSPDSSQVLTTGFDGTMRLWNGVTGRQLRVYQQSQPFVLSPTFSPDNRFVAASTSAGYVTIWDANSDRMIASFKQGAPNENTAFRFGGMALRSNSLATIDENGLRFRVLNRYGKPFDELAAEACSYYLPENQRALLAENAADRVLEDLYSRLHADLPICSSFPLTSRGHSRAEYARPDTLATNPIP